MPKGDITKFNDAISRIKHSYRGGGAAASRAAGGINVITQTDLMHYVIDGAGDEHIAEDAKLNRDERAHLTYQMFIAAQKANHKTPSRFNRKTKMEHRAIFHENVDNSIATKVKSQSIKEYMRACADDVDEMGRAMDNAADKVFISIEGVRHPIEEVYPILQDKLGDAFEHVWRLMSPTFIGSGPMSGDYHCTLSSDYRDNMEYAINTQENGDLTISYEGSATFVSEAMLSCPDVARKLADNLPVGVISNTVTLHPARGASGAISHDSKGKTVFDIYDVDMKFTPDGLRAKSAMT